MNRGENCVCNYVGCYSDSERRPAHNVDAIVWTVIYSIIAVIIYSPISHPSVARWQIVNSVTVIVWLMSPE